MGDLRAATMPTQEALHALYAQRADDWRRPHLGASYAGHECDRFVWLAFRWAAAPDFGGRMLRLFDRGHREEAWVLQDLRDIGVQVWDRDETTGDQFEVRWGHVAGHADAILLGLREAPKTPHLGEIKTHNRKQFEKLLTKGVQRSKPVHYVQMQLYMHGLGLERAFYVAICKDDDRIYTERVRYDRAFATAALDRAQRIALSAEPAARLDAAHPPCVYVNAEGTRFPCQFHDLCHGERLAEKNCRTCVSSTPQLDGTWTCDLPANEWLPALTVDAQRAGCRGHLTIPAVLNMQVALVDEARRQITYQAASGRRITDGEGTPEHHP